MGIKFLHTADWHLGQQFYNYDRTFEHKAFLNWLVQIIEQQNIDVLLIAGDIFDSANPSPEAQKLYYNFLANAIKIKATLQIIIIAGNHDSVQRLEAPKVLLNEMGIKVVGKLSKLNEATFDFEACTIPIYNQQNNVEVWCLAIPYLRPANFAHLGEAYKKYAQYVAEVYQTAYENISTKNEANKSIIALGHLHTLAADITNEDRNDSRQIIGGAELIPSTAFNKNLAYVGLGHIHKAQRIGKAENIRYCGSPIPMSFTEKNYVHQVIAFEIENNKTENITSIEVPITVPCIALPKKHETIEAVLMAIEQLPNKANKSIEATYPYLCINILQIEPDPLQRIKIEKALENKQARLAKIDCITNQSKNNVQQIETVATLDKLTPQKVFKDLYQKKYNTETPEALINLFNEVLQDLS